MLKQLFTEVEVARGKYPPLKTETLQAASKTNVKTSYKLRRLKNYNDVTVLPWMHRSRKGNSKLYTLRVSTIQLLALFQASLHFVFKESRCNSFS